MARAAGGRLILRIEDIDTARCWPEFETAIYQDLAWLGLTWEEPVRRQSEHLEEYRAALASLHTQDLIYPSFESRAEIIRLVAERAMNGPWPHDSDGAPLYPGMAKWLSVTERARRMASEPYALRLDMGAAMTQTRALTWTETGSGPDSEKGIIVAQPQAWGDVVLARKQMPTSYHLSVVIDDAHQGVTHVVRGTDLFWSTSVHRLLQELLGLPAPTYHHHRLIRDASGKKLSKSTRATALHELRARGVTPADIRRMIGLAA